MAKYDDAIALLTPVQTADGEVKYYDPRERVVWITHVSQNGPKFPMKVQLANAIPDRIPDPSKHIVIHDYKGEAKDLFYVDINVIRPGEVAHLVELATLDSRDWTKEEYNTHGLVSGVKLRDADRINLGGTIFGPGGIVIGPQGASGPNGSMSKPGSKYGTRQDYAGIFSKNPLSFLPSFAFLPLPSYLPSMDVFSSIANLTKALEEVVKSMNEAKKE